jgi:hypothetical protein
MFSSAELIEALRRRMRRSLRPERPPGEFPPGWRTWFASMQARADAVTGAAAESILAIFLAREPLPPPAAVESLNRWQAFATLWRQDWHPASEDERSVRILATVLSFILHILFVIVLIWLMYARFMGMAPDEEARRGEHVVQVEFIGKGTPEEQGGGPPQGETATPDAASAAAPPAPQPPVAAQPPSPSVPEPAVASEQPPQPQPPAPPVAQPLQVTETPAPDTTFVLPPTKPVDIEAPRVTVPEVEARTRDITVVEVPEIRPERRLPQREIAVPDLQLPPTDVRTREIPAPLPQLRTPSVAPPRIAAPELTPQAPQTAVRDIPMPSAPAPQPAASTGTSGQQTTAGESRAAESPTPGGRSTATTGARPDAPGAGSGPAPTPRPGALPSPRRSDDWGDSTRNRPGGQAGTPGLYNPDGTPRLAGNDGRVGGGLPPGTITEDYEKIDRMGTWLKRPPSDYEPTSFDRFWIPHENLLEEWVRRSIKEVLIPIPGTTKKIKCAVALLALGGACDITDPNLMDTEADGRKPPDVPFKPELQEDQDSLHRTAPADGP